MDGLINRIIKDDFENKKGKCYKINMDEEIIDKKLLNIATSFVVDNFFHDDSTLFSFLSLTYTTFEEAIAVYRDKMKISSEDLLFIYKGGNIIRLILKESLIELPHKTIRLIEEYYSKFFKRSDNDFSIMISPYLDNYDIVYYHMKVLAYYIQDYLRDQFLKNPMTYFDFFKYADVYKQHIFDKWIPLFNDFSSEKYRKMNLSVGTPDCMFVYADNNLFEVNRYIKKSEIYNNNSYMRITYNDALEFNSSSGEKIKFALIRTKIKFILYNCDYERNTYGELIDVSISHKDTFDIMYFFNNLKNNITRYRLEYNDKNLYFIGPSLEYMIKELENILFKVNILPWYDEKYKKRINRLMYLYFVELFIKLDNSYDRYTTLNKLKDELLNKSFVKIETNLKIDNLITNIIAIKDTENENFDDFINVIIQNLNFLIITLSNIEGYCNTDGKITKEDIYEGNVGSLI